MRLWPSWLRIVDVDSFVTHELKGDSVYQVKHSVECVEPCLQLILRRCAGRESAMGGWMPDALPSFNVIGSNREEASSLPVPKNIHRSLVVKRCHESSNPSGESGTQATLLCSYPGRDCGLVSVGVSAVIAGPALRSQTQ
jgi:hypothetical protein